MLDGGRRSEIAFDHQETKLRLSTPALATGRTVQFSTAWRKKLHLQDHRDAALPNANMSGLRTWQFRMTSLPTALRFLRYPVPDPPPSCITTSSAATIQSTSSPTTTSSSSSSIDAIPTRCNDPGRQTTAKLWCHSGKERSNARRTLLMVIDDEIVELIIQKMADDE